MSVSPNPIFAIKLGATIISIILGVTLAVFLGSTQGKRFQTLAIPIAAGIFAASTLLWTYTHRAGIGRPLGVAFVAFFVAYFLLSAHRTRHHNLRLQPKRHPAKVFDE